MSNVHHTTEQKFGSRLQLAQYLTQHRASIAEALVSVDSVFARTLGGNTRPVQLMLRTLIAAMASSIETSDPEILVHWARMSRERHAQHAITGALAAVCAEIAAIGETLHLDAAQLLVFLEIAQNRVFESVNGYEATRAADERSTIDTVLAMLRARDEATCAHSYQTGVWCRRLAEGMALSSSMTERIVKAGVLHDIGKIATPDSVLLKPGKLDADEWVIMQRHAQFGAELLSEIPALASYAPVIRSHHERIDGRGYPDSLAGEDIPFESRVLAVADAFHAMVSDRPYRAAMTFGAAMETLRQGRGTQWEADVVDVMIDVVAALRSRAADADLKTATGVGSDRQSADLSDTEPLAG